MGKLILRKIVKIAATILKLKCTKFDFGWSSAPDPSWGAYSASADLLAGFKGPTSKGKRGETGIGVRWRREWKENGNGDRPPTIFCLKVALSIVHFSHLIFTAGDTVQGRGYQPKYRDTIKIPK